jgi:hypothetical protein
MFFFMAASIMNGVCICRSAAAPGAGKGACVVSMDVCGTGASGVTLHSFDGASEMSPAVVTYYPISTVLPPEPSEAVATAEPGDIGKPPEA